MKERRSSIIEIEKEAHLQRRRNAYHHMKKTRGIENTSCNNNFQGTARTLIPRPENFRAS